MSTSEQGPIQSDSVVSELSSWGVTTPNNWFALPLKRTWSSVRNGKNFTYIEDEESAIPVSRIETISKGMVDLDRVGHAAPASVKPRDMLDTGDILLSHINSLPMVGNCALVEAHHTLAHGINLLRICPDKGTNPRFLMYLLRSHFIRQQIRSRANPAINQASISTAVLGAIPSVLPQREQQVRIANDLDRETARIDALIEKKTRFIELLKEKRQALITQAVTKGLEPKVPMKDSGVEWIGKVPTHWRVVKLKQLGKLKGGSGFPPALQGETDNEIGFYKVGDLGKSADGVHLAEANHSITQDQAKKLGARIFDVGTICWAKIGAALSLNRRRVLVSRACLDNNMTGFIVDQRIGNPSYCLVLMSIVDFSIHARPGAVPSFSEGDQGELQVPCPPLGEQAAIFANIQARTMRLDKLLAKTSASIDLLRERRSALITAAVTGQIDLRKNTA